MAYGIVAQKRKQIPQNVMEAATMRLEEVYAQGHRLVVSFSGGKDSTVTLETAIMAARKTNRLPVDVVVRDEEVAYPDVYEFCERTANRPEVNMMWQVAHQPVLNVFNRVNPYFWVFDEQMSPEEWFRKPPSFATEVPLIAIDSMTTPERFPVNDGQDLYAVIGLRTQESRARMYGLFSSRGHITKPNKHNVRSIRPIYDWLHGDVWKAILENNWKYCTAYDTMHRLGVSSAKLRIGPPTMTIGSIDQLEMAQKAWPKWFDRLSDRCEGVRTAAQFGRRAVTPQRSLGESWQDVFMRECINEAPADWIRQRAQKCMDEYLLTHSRHSHAPFPDRNPCKSCQGNIGSWRNMAQALYNGDPFSFKTKLPYVEPEFFRAGAGKWGGKPAW